MISPPSPRYYSEQHEAFRATLRQFVEREILPHVDAWDEAGEFPREIYRKAADIGALALGYPEEYGGVPADLFYQIVLAEELARSGAGGLLASLLSHMIAAPPIAAAASQDIKARVLPEILSGRKISALCVTEPSGGSDVANLRTAAKRDGNHYVVNGSKIFITSGMRADYLTVAVRTGGSGMKGVSLLLIEADTPGIRRTPLKKMGWWMSDTAQIFFDDVRVPITHLIGDENNGFAAVMRNFNGERLLIAASAYGFAKVCLEDAVAWAKDRQTFGAPLISRQVIRHKLVDMAMHIESTRALLEDLTWRVQQGERPVAQIAMLKYQSTQTMQFCADQAVQILGGMGFMRATRVERIYREVKVNQIGGGADEIMKDLAARQLGW
ncbi:MAG: acyl-CoA dehydrogenase family protein [Alphaproteobacteria bacterium]